MSVSDKPTVMIVDDEQNFTGSLRLTMEDEFTVFVAGSLESARQALQRFLPDVIFLELLLPDGDGLELFHDLKKLVKLPAVFAVTAHASVESYIKTLSEGCIDYLVKPVNFKQLKFMLKKILKNNIWEANFDD